MPKEIPGMEFAGTMPPLVSGSRAGRWATNAAGIVGGGSYAEQLTIHERLLLPIPGGVALDDAAAIPEVFLTAFDALVVQGGLTAGRIALVHAGASGVGTASIQIAKAMGAAIIVTCSTGKVQACLDLGADVVVDYTATKLVDAVETVTSGVGVDVILDVIGGEYTIDNIKSIKTKGRIIQVGVMGDQKVELPLGMLLAKRCVYHRDNPSGLSVGREGGTGAALQSRANPAV
ncbi:MAG: zinc-binding dehydrogenase [Acidimicrobiales bacterium]